MPFATNKSRAWFWANHPEAKREYEMKKIREHHEQFEWAMKHRGDDVAERWLAQFYPNIVRQPHNAQVSGGLEAPPNRRKEPYD